MRLVHYKVDSCVLGWLAPRRESRVSSSRCRCQTTPSVGAQIRPDAHTQHKHYSTKSSARWREAQSCGTASTVRKKKSTKINQRRKEEGNEKIREAHRVASHRKPCQQSPPTGMYEAQRQPVAPVLISLPEDIKRKGGAVPSAKKKHEPRRRWRGEAASGESRKDGA